MAATEHPITTPGTGQTVVLPGKVASPWWTRVAAIIGILTFAGVGISYIADRGDRASADDVSRGQELTQAQQECRSFIAARYDGVKSRADRLNIVATSLAQSQLRTLIATGELPTPQQTTDLDGVTGERDLVLKAFLATEQHSRDTVATDGWEVPPDIVAASNGILPARFAPCPTTLAEVHR